MVTPLDLDAVVLTIPSELQSARRLGLPTYTEPYTVPPSGTIIRWGNSEPVAARKGVHRVNAAYAIKTNCNKPEALKLMSTVVATPTLYLSGAEIQSGSLVVVRPVEHANGKGFSVRTGPFKVPAGHYATRWIETDTEYRVWFAWDRTLVARRVPVAGQAPGKYPCRSEWGYKFVKSPGWRSSHSVTLRRSTLLAAQRIGLQCGAADVLKVKPDVTMSGYVFLELNSAPSVDCRNIREFYQAAFLANLGKVTA